MGTCSETIYKHHILFPYIQHLAWLLQGRPQGKPKCGKNRDFWTYALTSASYNSETTEDLDRYMLRGIWQALNCLSIHATYCVIIAGASPGETKMWAAVRENCDFCTCGLNNWGTVLAARGLTSIELSFYPCNILRDNRRGVSRRNKNMGCSIWKRQFFALAVRITGKLL